MLDVVTKNTPLESVAGTQIFRDTTATPTQVANKVKALAGELVASNADISNENTPDRQDYSWFQEINPSLLSRTKTVSKHYSPWEIRLEEQEFIKW